MNISEDRRISRGRKSGPRLGGGHLGRTVQKQGMGWTYRALEEQGCPGDTGALGPSCCCSNFPSDVASHLCLALLSSLVTVKPYSSHWDEGYFMASQALPPAPTGLPLPPFSHPVHWFDWVLAYGIPRLVSRRKGV